MQLDPSRKLVRMLVERILDEVLPNETGAARLQQVGLFTLIYMLEDNEEPVTARRLAAMTGQSEGEIGLRLKKLMDIKLIERTQIKNKQGRGRAFELSIKHTPQTKRLMAAIQKASIGKR
jgi:predicted transcriptional regulator